MMASGLESAERLSSKDTPILPIPATSPASNPNRVLPGASKAATTFCPGVVAAKATTRCPMRPEAPFTANRMDMIIPSPKFGPFGPFPIVTAGRSSLLLSAGPLHERMIFAGHKAGRIKYFPIAVRPVNLDGIHTHRLAQTEVQPPVRR